MIRSLIPEVRRYWLVSKFILRGKNSTILKTDLIFYSSVIPECKVKRISKRYKIVEFTYINYLPTILPLLIMALVIGEF